jgi:HlyD family secretion protein
VRPPSRRLYFLVAVAALGALAWGAYGRWQQRAAAIETQPQIVNFVREVRVAVAKRQDGPVLLTLPGTVLPLDQARIFARATGYVAERHVDIGSRVQKGDLLLRIAAPDLDHQLSNGGRVHNF